MADNLAKQGSKMVQPNKPFSIHGAKIIKDKIYNRRITFLSSCKEGK